MVVACDQNKLAQNFQQQQPCNGATDERLRGERCSFQPRVISMAETGADLSSGCCLFIGAASLYSLPLPKCSQKVSIPNMADSEYSGSLNPEGSLPPSVDSKEPKFSCTTNKLIVGVAAVAPVAWSSDGAWLVHATGDNSLHVCHKPGSSVAFKVHGVLVGHSETVTCLVGDNLLHFFCVPECLPSQAFHPMEPTLLVSAAADGLWFWNVADCRFFGL
jgi:hypothetical protein